jgi:hypothetical protein
MEDIGPMLFYWQNFAKKKDKNKNLKISDFEVFYLLDMRGDKVKKFRYIYLIFNV